MTNDISIKKAGLINASSKYASVILNLFFTAILARLLSPNDYGIIAVTAVFTNFFVILADMGIGTGIIQNKTLTEKEINSIFGLTIYLGLALTILFALFGYPLSFFYKNQIYIGICLILSLSLTFNTFNMVPNALLMKDKQFIKVAIRNIVVPVITNVIAILLAFVGFKYYALVIQSVLLAFFTFMWNYYSARKDYKLKPYFKVDLTGFNKIKNYSGFQFMFSLVNYFSRNLDNLLISKVFNEAILGIYDKAYRLMLYPLNMLTGVITPVLHPILSEHQDNYEYIYMQYIKILKLLSTVGILIVPICFVSNVEIIQIMFGKQWIAAAPCFQALSLSVWCQLLTSSTGSIFQSIGKTHLMLKSSLINTGITIGCLVIGLSSGKIEMMSCFISFAYIVNYIVTFFILMHDGLNYSFMKLNKELFLDMMALILITIISFVVLNNFVFNNIFISLIVKSFFVLFLFITYEVVSGNYKLLKSCLKK